MSNWMTKMSFALGLNFVTFACVAESELAHGEDDAEAVQAISILAGYDLTGTPSNATIGATVSANFVAPDGHSANDWVGLYPVGGADYQLLNYVYVPPVATGSIVVPVPATATAGQSYELRYYLNNAYTLAARSDSFVADALVHGLSNGPVLAQPGSQVSISWSAPQNHSVTDWIGLYSTGGTNFAYVSWAYVGSAGLGNGTTAMLLPGSASPGDTYEFRYLLNNGYQDAARSQSFTVGNQLSAPVGPIPAGNNVACSWGAPAAHAVTDWIGLFRTGTSNSSYVTWGYVGSAGQTTGAVTLVLPANAIDGESFECRYFTNNSYTLVGASNSFEVGVGYSLQGPAAGTPGQNVNAMWTAPANHSITDWIGLYAVGASPSAVIAYSYVAAAGQTAGTTPVSLPVGLGAGSYELRYHTNNTYSLVATSSAFPVPPAP